MGAGRESTAGGSTFASRRRARAGSELRGLLRSLQYGQLLLQSFTICRRMCVCLQGLYQLVHFLFTLTKKKKEKRNLSTLTLFKSLYHFVPFSASRDLAAAF